MKSWRVRLAVALTAGAMMLSVSAPAMAHPTGDPGQTAMAEDGMVHMMSDRRMMVGNGTAHMMNGDRMVMAGNGMVCLMNGERMMMVGNGTVSEMDTSQMMSMMENGQMMDCPMVGSMPMMAPVSSA